MIQTKEFSITKKEYLNILLKLHYRKLWWLYVAAVLLAFVFFKDFGHDNFATFFVVYPVVLVIWLYVRMRRWAYSDKNKIVLLPRQFTIDNDKISGVVDKNSISEIPLKYVVKIVKLKDVWIIYISKGQFIFIPKSSFLSVSDEIEFEDILKGLKVKRP